MYREGADIVAGRTVDSHLSQDLAKEGSELESVTGTAADLGKHQSTGAIILASGRQNDNSNLRAFDSGGVGHLIDSPTIVTACH